MNFKVKDVEAIPEILGSEMEQVDRSSEVGLEINTSNTKVMTNSTPTDITVNRQKLEYVYLGQIISQKDQMSIEIAKIKLESTGDAFTIKRGDRQGDPLSPKLFTALLEQMFRKLNWENQGLNINGARLSHQRVADDLVILESNPLTLESMIQTLVDRSSEVCLEIITSKTKGMTNSTPTDITINRQKLEYVEEYVYLGHIILQKDQMSIEIV
ncbi:endonuclease-reverse transcriptase [Danaus plexippus plexippus]|uniref:Endonuclease-reverse transcriptase n=1 Tax=Danaus plexippus plexippus TaxID=278856 RepID=A0A212F5W9_DANPL|nr:endonuclease-reverse transcriptase [Danaus plexippus plexippus]